MDDFLQLTWPEPGIALLTLNRPVALNALTDEGVDALHRLLADLSTNAALRVLVITGAGLLRRLRPGAGHQGAAGR